MRTAAPRHRRRPTRPLMGDPPTTASRHRMDLGSAGRAFGPLPRWRAPAGPWVVLRGSWRRSLERFRRSSRTAEALGQFTVWSLSLTSRRSVSAMFATRRTELGLMLLVVKPAVLDAELSRRRPRGRLRVGYRGALRLHERIASSSDGARTTR